jgi:hypothetical protein
MRLVQPAKPAISPNCEGGFFNSVNCGLTNLLSEYLVTFIPSWKANSLMREMALSMRASKPLRASRVQHFGLALPASMMSWTVFL